MPHRNPPTEFGKAPFGEKFETQIVYKLGTIEADVKSLSSNLLAAVLRLEGRIEESGNTTTREILSLESKVTEKLTRTEKRLDMVERDLDKLEAWKNSIMIKLGFVVSAVSVFWFAFSEAFKELVGRMVSG